MSRYTLHVARFVAPSLLLSALCSLFIARPVLADGSYCVCRTTAFICTNFRGNDVVVPGGTVGGPITTAQCDAFCAGRGTGTTNVHLGDAFAGVVSTCSSQCVDGGSCTAALGAPGIPSLNLCIANGAIYPSVPTLDRCCQYLRTDGSSGAGVVGYNGGPQACAGTAPVSGDVAPLATAIPLFNPLGSDVDIPAFIGRGIRGVLGVIGAIALLMFVYGGVTWMTAGDSERVGNAKNIIKNSIIGLLLIFFSYNLIGIFFDFFSA